MNFQQHHGAMLLKYAGISFISGAVNHGFFSGERSLWTAAIGMVLFGAVLRSRTQAMQQGAGYGDGHSHGTGAAITLGAG